MLKESIVSRKEANQLLFTVADDTNCLVRDLLVARIQIYARDSVGAPKRDDRRGDENANPNSATPGGGRRKGAGRGGCGGSGPYGSEAVNSPNLPKPPEEPLGENGGAGNTHFAAHTAGGAGNAQMQM